ncbi:MAG TPA: response regulator [Candidatus Acidoferrales bacterium]|nr:response regulator [Candidatus Acidoferrales bacterium]
MPNTTTLTTETDPLAEAIELARLGKKGEARRLIKEACRINPENAKAWLWSASLAETVADAINDLQQVVALDPKNPTAHAWLERLRPSMIEVPWYQCFLCEYEGREEFARCPQCHAVLSLDLDETFRNQGVDERQVRLAVERIQKFAGSADPFDIAYYLGVAHLNLMNSNAALEHFRRAEPLDERGAQLRGTIAALSRRPLVMAVDDCLTIRTMVMNILERNGYRCLSAASSVDALSYLENASPEFVLLDVSMPFMDGYALCKRIKSQPNTKDTAVVMLSARDGFMDKVKGRMSGAADYLTKPFEPALLLRIIRKYVHPKE